MSIKVYLLNKLDETRTECDGDITEIERFQILNFNCL